MDVLKQINLYLGDVSKRVGHMSLIHSVSKFETEAFILQVKN